MEQAEELLFRELEEVRFSPWERELIMAAKTYFVTLETHLVTDVQMTELLILTTKVGGKFEYKEIPRSSIAHKQCEENLKKAIRVNRPQNTMSDDTSDQPTSSQQADKDLKIDEQMESQDLIDVKDEIEETHIDSFGNQRPLCENRDLIENEEYLRNLM